MSGENASADVHERIRKTLGLPRIIDGIKYDLLELEDAETVNEYYLKYFFPREPWSKNWDIDFPNNPTMRKAWLRIVQQSAREGLGLIARNDKEIVAARLTLREQRGVPHSKDPDEESIPDNIAGMFKFIKVSGNAVDIFDKYQVDEYAHFFGIVSKPEYGGRGYAQKLLNLSYDLLRSEGFKYVKVETGNPILFHVFEKHGYELVHRTTMKEFTFKGVVPVDKDDEWRVLVKKL